MTNVKTCMRLLALLAMMLGMGCAPAYRSYSDGHVDCKYCAPPPLPYAHYDDCVCHACVASQYLPLPRKTIEPQEAPEPEEPQNPEEQTEPEAAPKPEAVESGDDRPTE